MLFYGRHWVLTGMVTILALLLAPSGFAIEISSRYRSPRNPERRVRAATELIVLHTTEAPARSSLNKLSDRGEAHYCVTEEGSVYAIVDRDRVAFHAGRSMWKGKEDVDNFSIGIECVGYHDKPMSTVQLTAIRDLVKALQSMYRIPDECVVCHSHVAYGSPNRWQKRRHRGRKRCGMLFAMPSVRRVLELGRRPGVDVDALMGRLAVGDEYLRTVLYGKTDTMAASYPKPGPAPKATVKATVKAPPKREEPKRKPEVAVKRAGPPKRAAGGKAAKPAAAAPRSIAQLRVGGYVQKGTVTKTVTASKIAGAKWNAPDTYYTIRGKVFPGNTIDSARIENGMCVWMKK